MQKRNLDIQYGNTNDEDLGEGYTFIYNTMIKK